MGADDEIALARLNDDVMHRHRRNVVFELRPRHSLHRGVEHAEFGAGEEEVGLDGIFSNDLHRPIRRQAAVYRLPMRAVVGALDHVWSEIVVAMVVERGVDGAFLESRSDDATDVRLIRNVGKLGVFGPRRPAVARYRDHAVVGADIKQSLPDRRLVDRADVPVVGSALVTRDRIARPDLPHHREAVAIELAREIGAESHPRVTTIGALEQVIRAEVERVVIVRRD